jgi:hypothetical protein
LNGASERVPHSNAKTKTAPAIAGAAWFLVYDLRLEGSAGCNSNILLLNWGVAPGLVSVDDIQRKATDLPAAISNGEDIAKVSTSRCIASEPAEGDGVLAEDFDSQTDINDFVCERVTSMINSTQSNGTQEESLSCRDEEGVVNGN